MRKKYIFVTGGVISGIGKGVTTAATGFFFTPKYNVTPIKLDGYLNIDPGTMNPQEHGEVFVLEDGGEVDMDFGHYERFLGAKASSMQSISMGKIYAGILEKERRGDFLGKTVQMIPHATNYIIERLEDVFRQSAGDICLIEIGGTVGDIEVELYLEALRQLSYNKRDEDVLHIHLTYVPTPGGVKEQKTKPTQQSIHLLQSKGLFPDIIVARGESPLSRESKKKISLFGNVKEQAVFSLPDLASIYSIPSVLYEQGFESLVMEKLDFKTRKTPKLRIWEKYLESTPTQTYKIAILGKYTGLEDSYSSVVEALHHAGLRLGIHVELCFIDARKTNGIDTVKECNACIVPGGFGSTAVENMLTTLTYIRKSNIPCLGICLGMQLMVIEFSRNVLGIKNASSIEFEKDCYPYDVITLLDSQKNIVNLGGTMRLGGQGSILRPGKIYDLYSECDSITKTGLISERFRHRYEVNPLICNDLEENGFLTVGLSKNEGIVQFVEMEKNRHKYYVGTQSHPELKSTLDIPAPLFVGLLKACMK